jgi:hypothetical protein
MKKPIRSGQHYPEDGDQSTIRSNLVHHPANAGDDDALAVRRHLDLSTPAYC